MATGSDALLESIDKAMLTPLLRQALGSETVEVTSWDTQQIHGGCGTAGGSAVHRVSGCSEDQVETADWSLVLKVLYPPTDRGQPPDYDYRRREADAYQSGLLDDLPGGLAAPRWCGVVDRPNGECWIWMEDVQDDFGPKWPLEHYVVVARHLGQFNGAYLTGQWPIPSSPWLRRRGWLREEAVRGAPEIIQLHNSLDHPLVRRACPPDVVDAISRRWAEGERSFDARVLDALCRLPPDPLSLRRVPPHPVCATYSGRAPRDHRRPLGRRGDRVDRTRDQDAGEQYHPLSRGGLC